jgi:hypothetical protein
MVHSTIVRNSKHIAPTYQHAILDYVSITYKSLPGFIMDKLSVSEIKALILKTEESFRHQECATCECYLGFITQLEIDADQEAQEYIRDIQPPKELVHSCLGCDPCPPGILYEDHLKKTRV